MLYTYNKFSVAAKALAMALGIKRIKQENSRFKWNKTVLNFGSTVMPEGSEHCAIINHPELVKVAIQKDLCLAWLWSKGVSVPPFSTTMEGAEKLFEKDSDVVFCRTKLCGKGGEGIVMANSPDELVLCDLYVKYIPKKDEYRVHVVDGQVIDFSRKARNRDIPDEEINWKVRNHDNGFIFMREGVEPPLKVLTEALNAVTALKLEFGAVDVIWNEKHEQAYVLEVNTAPGLEGTTLERYRDALSKYFYLPVPKRR